MTNPSSDHLWDVAQASDRSGFQRTLAGCHDHRGRSGFAVDPDDGCRYKGQTYNKLAVA